jgi:CRP/FNR family cyclic AMP-dependent transcriptional regulator
MGRVYALKPGAQPVPNSLGRQPNIFAQLNEHQLAIVLACAERRRFAKGETVFAQGQPHQGVFVIESGILRTYYVAPNGREITLMYWQPGNLVGTPEVLGQSVYRWSGVTMAATEVLAFKSPTLRSLIMQMPELSLGIIEALEFKGKCFSVVIQMLGTMNVAERLGQALRTIADIHGERTAEGIVLSAPFTHEALATLVGASRQWVTTELHNMEKKAILRTGRCGIVITRPELL